MIVMPANATGIRCGYVAAKYEHAPARLGHLFSPGAQTGPHYFMPYALDNGAFSCWQKKKPFNVEEWRDLLQWAAKSGQRPLWCLVPDVVCDRDATLTAWDRFAPEADSYGWPLAFAAQDGMRPDDVPMGASTVFMGGSYDWKWSSIREWSRAFPGRLHVGRVNGLRQLRICADEGVASCDGTGFSRTARQWQELGIFLAEMNGERSRDEQLLLCDDLDERMDHGSKYSALPALSATGGAKCQNSYEHQPTADAGKDHQ